MIQSPELGELLTALSAFQGAIEAVPKDSDNPFFKSRFAGLPAVVKAATPHLVANGLCVSQHLGHDEQGDTLTTIVGHTSGQFLGDTMHLRPIKDDPQAQGSATTYGRRYAYMAALGLVADEDDDGNAGSATGSQSSSQRRSTPKPAKAKPKISGDRVATLTALTATAGGKRVADTLKEMNVSLGKTIPDTMAMLTPEQADKFEKAIGGELLPANAEPLKGGE